MADEGQIRRDICEVGRRLWMQGLVAATDGNFSCRLTADALLATPTATSKGFLSPDEIVKIDMTGAVLEGSSRPSSEIKMHLAIYAARPDAGAVVHGHPPAATAFAAARIPVPTEILTEAHTYLGPVAVAEYAKPGTDGVAEGVGRHAPQHNAILLANHGAVTVGRTLLEAMYRMEALDQAANIAIAARQLGGAVPIADEDLSKLDALRQELGLAPSDTPWRPDA